MDLLINQSSPVLWAVALCGAVIITSIFTFFIKEKKDGDK